MQKRIITLLMIIAGASLGISLFPMAWEMAKQGNNSWLNNNFTNGLIGAIIAIVVIDAAAFILQGKANKKAE